MQSTTAHRTSVFVVEDSPAIRARLTSRLEAIDNVDVVGEAETADAAVEGILREHPDSVLLDIRLTSGTGLDVLRKVHAQEPATLFIVLTNQPDESYRRIYLGAGAAHFLDKSNEFEKAVELIADLAKGPDHISTRGN